MARHIDYDVIPGASAAQIWRELESYLVTHESVEVVKERGPDGKWRFELRVWTGVRADGSNGPNPPSRA